MGILFIFQGHSAPGMYARAFLEGRMTTKQLDGFRQEVAKGGLSSYPHPWLMPNFGSSQRSQWVWDQLWQSIKHVF